MQDFVFNSKVIVHSGFDGRRGYEVAYSKDVGRGESNIYRRVAGGVGWPGSGRNGFLVVLAEDMDEDLEHNVRHLHRLAELEEWEGLSFTTLPPMFAAMSFLSGNKGVHPWYGLECPSWEDMLRYNRDRAALKRSPLRITQLRDPDFERMMGAIFRRTTTQKTLHLGKSNIPAALARLGRDVSGENFTDHPMATALLMAVNGLEYSQPGRPAPARNRIADRVGGY